MEDQPRVSRSRCESRFCWLRSSHCSLVSLIVTPCSLRNTPSSVNPYWGQQPDSRPHMLCQTLGSIRQVLQLLSVLSSVW